MMRRREFITLLGGGAAWPIAARGEPDRMRRVGIQSDREVSRTSNGGVAMVRREGTALELQTYA